MLLAATLLVAAASWRFIERPVRARVLMKSTRTLLVGVGVGSAGILLAGLVLWNSDGFPQRFPPETRGLIVSTDRNPGARSLRRGGASGAGQAGRVCNYGPGDRSPKVLVWGDSHALALMPAVNALAKAHGMHTYFVAKYTCLPLFAPPNPTRIDAATDRYRCAAFNAAVVEAIARLKPELIILDGAWDAAEPPPHVPDIAAGIEQTVSRVGDRSRSICVVFAVPTLKYAVSHALVVARRRHIPDDFLRLSRADALAQHREHGARGARHRAAQRAQGGGSQGRPVSGRLLPLQGRRPVALLRRQSPVALRRVVCGAHARAMLRRPGTLERTARAPSRGSLRHCHAPVGPVRHGRSQQNGRQERMHLTAEEGSHALRPPETSCNSRDASISSSASSTRSVPTRDSTCNCRPRSTRARPGSRAAYPSSTTRSMIVPSRSPDAGGSAWDR